MRNYHVRKNKNFCPTLNCDKLWSLVGDQTKKLYEDKENKQKKAPVIDIVKSVRFYIKWLYCLVNFCDDNVNGRSESIVQMQLIVSIMFTSDFYLYIEICFWRDFVVDSFVFVCRVTTSSLAKAKSPRFPSSLRLSSSPRGPKERSRASAVPAFCQLNCNKPKINF